MIDPKCARERFKTGKFFRNLKYKRQFNKDHPGYFHPSGLVCFVGPQGSGKTLSAVNYVYNLLMFYPQAKLITNIQLTDYPIVSFTDFINKNKEEYLATREKAGIQADKIFYDLYLKNNRVFEFKDNEDFGKYNNGDKGVIFLVDEIQLYLNSLQSKNINMDVMTQISQQRKQRKHIVCTSQVFGRMAKPLREQFSNVVLCRCLLNCIQWNKEIDRDSMNGDSSTDTEISGKVKHQYFYFHDPMYYKRYDTYYVIERNKFVDGEKQLPIYSTQEQQNISIENKIETDKKGGIL